MSPEKTLWFAAKRYGWGWIPVTWQGWLVVAAYVAFALAWPFVIMCVIPKTEWETNPNAFIAFYGGLGIATALLIRICYAKGEKPRWRWGRE